MGRKFHQTGATVQDVLGTQDLHQQGVRVLRIRQHGRHSVPQPAGAVRDLPVETEIRLAAKGVTSKTGGGGPLLWWAV